MRIRYSTLLTLLLLIIGATASWADRARFEGSSRSGWNPSNFGVGQTCFEVNLKVGENWSNYSFFNDDAEIGFMIGEKKYKMAKLSDFGIKSKSACGSYKAWNSHMQSLRSNDAYFGLVSSIGNKNQYDAPDWALAVYDFSHSDKYDYWVGLCFCFGTIYADKELKVYVTGNWYEDEKNKGTITMTVSPRTFPAEWKSISDNALTRPEPYKLNFQNDLQPHDDWGYSVEFYKSIDHSGAPMVSGTVGAKQSRANLTMGDSKTVNDAAAYTLYPALCKTKSVEYKLSKDGGGEYKFTMPTRVYSTFDNKALNVPCFPYPTGVNAVPDPWNKAVNVTWNSKVNSSNKNTNGAWTIWRSVGNGALTKVGETSYTTTTFTDNSPAYGVAYTYHVAFQPQGWSYNGSNLSAHLKSSFACTMNRNFKFAFNANDVVGKESEIDVKWKYGTTFANASSSNQYTVKLLRRVNGGSWATVSQYTITTPDVTEGSYVDTNVGTSCDLYEYKLSVEAQGTTFESGIQSASILGQSRAVAFSATRGEYTGTVKLNWDVEQIGQDPTYFTVYRRLNGTDGDWKKIYTTNGTGARYSYDDNTALPGTYYEYQLECSTLCGNKMTISTSLSGDGFALSSGVASGRVTFGSGMAVEGVKVMMIPEDESKSQFYSLYTSGTGSGVVYEPEGNDASVKNAEIKRLFENKDWTYQMYVRPDLQAMNKANTNYMVADVFRTISLYLNYDPAKNGYQIVEYINGGYHKTGIYIPGNQYSQITFSYSAAQQTTSVYAHIGDSLATAKIENQPLTVDNSATCLSVGNDAAFNFGYPMQGHIDEVRLWSGKALTEAEVEKNYDRILAGTEDGLALYWPMDEGVNKRNIYDYSKTGGVANGRHGLLKTNSSVSTLVPSAEQLSLCAYTDSLGNYVIRGIPYSGEGVNYSITPSKGVHEFSPIRSTRYISSNSLVHSSVDFTDVSSFKVRGTVYYSGTDYPVEGCNFLIDGNVCAKDGELIASNENGEYEISVPIGRHSIQVRKNGHTFDNNGRYPADPYGVGTDTIFVSERSNLDFYDNTLVNFTGRVVGGNIEGGKELGFGLSQNNIGKADITMTPVNPNYRTNVIKKVSGLTYQMVNNPETVDCASGTDLIKSQSYRGAGDYSSFIYIQTDPETGEFSAMVPPLQYKVTGIEVKSSAMQLLDGAELVDLSDPLLVYTDTLDTGETYDYNAALMKVYHSTPVFIVTDKNNTDGALGLKDYTVSDQNGTFVVNDLYSKDASGKITYKYGAPIFKMADSYTFNIEAYEEYTNRDKETPAVSRVPLSGTVVTVENALSISQSVYIEDGNDQGKDVKAGDVSDLKSNQLELDEEGKAVYTWRAGLPNITAPYIRTIGMTYENDGSKYTWMDGGQPGIILGELSTGANFVTAGPDKVHMILRDPPGTGSHAEWTKGTVKAKHKLLGSKWSTETELNTQNNLGCETKIATGLIGVATINEAKVYNTLEVGAKVVSQGENSNSVDTEITAERTISTSSEPEYVGSQGDVFVGTSTNFIFGKARQVGLYRTSPNSTEVELALKDVLTTNMNFSTTFSYTQNYVENVLLPNLDDLKASYLQTVTKDVVNQYTSGSRKNTTGHVLYLTTLSPDDEKWGTRNTDEIWGDQVVGKDSLMGPSYYVIKPENVDKSKCFTDSVSWINWQIESWTNTLSKNEEEKVKAFANRGERLIQNVSFDSGAKQTYTCENDTTTISESDWEAGCMAILGDTWGVGINGAGVVFNLKTETGGTSHHNESESITEKASFMYELAEEGDDDALTVDVLSSDNYGPIFHTRGGQTCNPYEGVEYTKYYEPGRHKLHDGTMQIEVPLIDVDQATVVDVPSGSAANFTLRLTNASEINEDVYYRLLVIDETNDKGAKITIDGQPLTEGRMMKIPAGETVTKTMQLTQSNLSVLEYEKIGIVLASPTQYDPTSTWDVIADTVYVSAYFVPTSSSVSLRTSSTVVNMFTGTDLSLTFSGYDRNYYNLKAFRLQYKYEGDADWTQVREYVINENDVTQSNELLPTGSDVTYLLDMAPWSDGNYTFRVVSVSTYGGKEIYKYSDEVAVYKDTARPALLGSANPADGILDTDDDISVRFNEDIRSGALTKTKNFAIVGALNDAAVDHETSMALTDTEVQAQTDVDIDIAAHDFALGFWINRQTDGTILTLGTAVNGMKVGTADNGRMTVTMAGNTYKSDTAIPANEWTYVAMRYSQDADGGRISATAAYDASTVRLFRDESVVTNTANGRMTIGSGMTGAINQLTLWNVAMDDEALVAQRNKSRAASTQGLIGYWKMDEGHGTVMTDVARSRNLYMTAENWAINNVNKAAHMDGNSRYAIDFSKNSFMGDESYAMEMWIRPSVQKRATIFQSGDAALTVTLNETGQMEVATPTETYKTNVTLTTGNWHHVALNVLRGASAILYVDGNNALTMTEQAVPSLQGDSIIIGSARRYEDIDTQGRVYTFYDGFEGDIDEVRIWNASLQGKYLTDNRFCRVDTAMAKGLVVYMPMETSMLDDNNQVVTQFTLKNIINGEQTAQTVALPTEAVAAPGLKSAPAMTNLQYNFTASEREIFITLNETPARLEGTTVYMTLSNIRDMHDNVCVPVVWSAYVRQNPLRWTTTDQSLDVRAGETATFTATFTNSGGVSQEWSLTGMPAWLTADMTEGVLGAGKSQTINFTTSDATAIGRYTETVSLVGNSAIYEPLGVSLKVRGKEPEWAVDVDKYDKTMNLTAQVYINDVVCENTDTRVAAFEGDVCVGLAQPQYIPTRDAYYLCMTIYGNSEMVGREISFKVWDASSGVIYAGVAPSQQVTFADGSIYGTFNKPVILKTSNNVEQQTSLMRGWNWTSFFVQPENNSINAVMGRYANNITLIKDRTEFSASSGTKFTGSLLELDGAKLYMMNANDAETIVVNGRRLTNEEAKQTVNKNWNWIGNPCQSAMSLDEAFAGLNPEVDDLVKSRNAFAIYNGYTWEGTLTGIEPGKGYLYYSESADSKTFMYPERAAMPKRMKAQKPQIKWFTVDDMSQYPCNMTIIAEMYCDGQMCDTLELAAYVGDECRAAVKARDSKYFIAVPGDGSGQKVEFKTYLEGKYVSVTPGVTYSNDAMIGNLKVPLELYVDMSTGIQNITVDEEADMYDLSGRKVKNERSVPRGIYIKGGKKQVVR